MRKRVLGDGEPVSDEEQHEDMTHTRTRNENTRTLARSRIHIYSSSLLRFGDPMR